MSGRPCLQNESYFPGFQWPVIQTYYQKILQSVPQKILSHTLRPCQSLLLPQLIYCNHLLVYNSLFHKDKHIQKLLFFKFRSVSEYVTKIRVFLPYLINSTFKNSRKCGWLVKFGSTEINSNWFRIPDRYIRSTIDRNFPNIYLCFLK